MNPSEGVKLTLKGQEYILRLTIPRLREMSSRTGKGTRQILLEAIGLNFDSIVWLLWACIAQPENPKQKDLSFDQAMALFDPQETGAVVDGLSRVVEASFMKPRETSDPQ